MGISTFTSKEFVIFCRVSKIGNVYMVYLIIEYILIYDDILYYIYDFFSTHKTWFGLVGYINTPPMKLSTMGIVFVYTQ